MFSSFHFNRNKGIPLPESQDNGISSGSSASSQHPVTAIVTTGPDGTTIDEASQQSTISNASAGMKSNFNRLNRHFS